MKRNIENISFCLVSFLSGATALIYQITWIRRFSHLFGLQVLSVSVVLGTFMAGLALGSLIFGKISDRKNPVILFMIIEAGLSLFAFFFQLLFQGFSELYTFIGNNFLQSVSGIQLLRCLLSFLFLIIPSTLIGGTLPVLVKIITKQIGSIGKNLSILYALNNLGAFAGCLMAGFILIRYTGIAVTMAIGGMINLFNAVFILVIFLSSFQRSQQDVETEKPDIRYYVPVVPRNIIRLLLIVFTVEGFATLSFEVLWTRVFIEFSYDKTVYLYTTIIAAFISGLSIGGFIISKFINKLNDLVSFTGYLEVAIGLLSLLQLFLVVVIMPEMISERELTHAWINVPMREYLVIFLFIQIPVILMGMTLPVIGKLYANEMVNLGGKIGIIGMLDTAGSIAGSFIAGFIILPGLGVSRSIIFTALLNIIMGLMLLGFHPEKKMIFRKSLIPGIVLICILMIMFFPGDPYYKTKIGKKPGQEIIYYDEAACGTVAIHRYPLGYSALSINGVLFAYNTSDDLRSHRMLACMPYFFHPDPDKVLVLGFGLGITAGFFTLEDIETITVAEICPPVIRASSGYFAAANHNVLNDKRLEIIPEDGRAWLLFTGRKFDIITCDAIHPRYGNNLYTREYYELCKEHLNKNGVLCQWMPTNWMTEFEYKSLLRTFQSVFPNTSLWYVNRGVTLAVGSTDTLRMNVGVLQTRMGYQQITRDLAETDILDPEMLLARFCLNDKDLTRYCTNGNINTDDHPFVEYGKVISMAPNHEILQSLVNISQDPFDILTGWSEIQSDTAGFSMKISYCRNLIKQELLQNIEILKMEP